MMKNLFGKVLFFSYFFSCFFTLFTMHAHAYIDPSAVTFMMKKENLTAEQAEKVLGKELKTYVGEMYISSIWGFILVISTLIFSTYTSNYIFSIIVAILWIISPFLAWYISREKEDKVFYPELRGGCR